MSHKTIEAELMQQVVSDLDDDVPRLVLADWYEEQGDPRGQFIRAQCQMEALEHDDPSRCELEEFVDQTISTYRAQWLKNLPTLAGVAWGNYCQAMHEGMWDYGRRHFRRGFVELVAIKDFKSLKANLTALRKYGLASYLDVISGELRCYEMLYKEPFVRGLQYFQKSGKVFDGIAKMTSREKLRALSVHECNLDQAAAEHFTTIDLPALRSLDLHFNDLEESLDTLLGWSVMPNLRWLDLSLNSLGDAPGRLTRLMSEPNLANLSALAVGSNYLTVKELRSAAKTCAMNRLTKLDLAGNRLEDAGVSAVLKLPLSKLSDLDLSHIDCTSVGVQKLARSKQLSNLRRLSLNYNRELDDVGIAAIAQSKHLGGLTHLDLAKTRLGEEGAAALIESESLTSIQLLDIGTAKLKPATIKALQKRYPKAIKKAKRR